MTPVSSVIVISMSAQGHPEDEFSQTRIFYTGQGTSALEDQRICNASFLLRRDPDFTDRYNVYRVRFVRQVRARSSPDSRNKGTVSYRPLFEFENLGPLPTLDLGVHYDTYLEPKMYALLSHGLVCKYKTVGRGILPCTYGTLKDIPPLSSLLNHFKRGALISMIDRDTLIRRGIMHM